jgi:hypothetical protein
MNPNILKLLALLGAGGMAAAPALMTGSREDEPQMLDSDSEEAQMMQAERQAGRDYMASPARQDRMRGAMMQDPQSVVRESDLGMGRDPMGMMRSMQQPESTVTEDEMEDPEERERQLKLQALGRVRNGF